MYSPLTFLFVRSLPLRNLRIFYWLTLHPRPLPALVLNQSHTVSTAFFHIVASRSTYLAPPCIVSCPIILAYCFFVSFFFSLFVHLLFNPSCFHILCKIDRVNFSFVHMRSGSLFGFYVSSNFISFQHFDRFNQYNAHWYFAIFHPQKVHLTMIQGNQIVQNSKLFLF